MDPEKPEAEDLVPAPPPEPPVDYKPPEDAPPIPVRPAKAGLAENLAAAPLLKTGPVPPAELQQYVPPPDAPPSGAQDLAASGASGEPPVEMAPPQQYKPPEIQPGSAEDSLLGRKVGPCRVDALIGQGGMGAVYRAHHIALDRPVALKVIAPEWLGTPAVAEAFLREARIAARLEDPRIVQVYDVGVYGEQTYIVLQFVAGETLEARVARQGPLPPAEALRVVKEAAKALAVAHKQGVVHRDVKPANIMLGPDGSVRLMDFGLSVMAGRSEVPQEGISTMGSFDFMAPEQGFGAPPDPRMDLYSLGAVYFYALAGRPPFLAKNAGDMLLQHRESQIPDVRQFRRDASASAAGLIRRLMAKKPSGRPAGAAHLIQELESSHMLLDVDASGSPFALLPPPVEETPEGFKPEEGFTPHAAEEESPPEPEEPEPPAAGASGSAGTGGASDTAGAVRPPSAEGAPPSPLPALPVQPRNRPLVVKVVSGVVAVAVLARLWRQASGADWAAAGAFAALAAAFVTTRGWRLLVRNCAAGLLLAVMGAAFWRFGLGAWALPARTPELETLILCGLGLASIAAGFYLGLWTPDRRTGSALIAASAVMLLLAALAEQALTGQSWSSGVRTAASLRWREFVSSGGLWRWGGMLGLSWAGVFLWQRQARQSLRGKAPLQNWNR